MSKSRLARTRLLASLAAVLLSTPAAAEFIGPFELGPAGCEATGQCTLSYDFKYIDPNGVGWQAAAHNTTDGASIPPWAQPFIGSAFDQSFIKPAVIHDHYCDRHVRGWRATHRVFYDALLELAVGTAKAKLMYYAVYLGGPKWVKLIPGQGCGANCLFRVAPPGAAEIAAAGAMSAGPLVVSRPESYDQEGFAEELKEVEKLLNEQGDTIDLQMLEKRAKDKRPNDFYYSNDDEIAVTGGLATE